MKQNIKKLKIQKKKIVLNDSLGISKILRSPMYQ